MVIGNRLERKATLAFNFSFGACTVLNQFTIVLCFDYIEDDVCYHSNNPLGSFRKLPNSNYHHGRTRITSFDGKNKNYKKYFKNTWDTLIAVGDYNPKHNHVELFNLANSRWKIKKDYPYSQDIYGYSILAVEKKFIIFGGYSWIRKVFTNQEIKY